MAILDFETCSLEYITRLTVSQEGGWNGVGAGMDEADKIGAHV